jgi:GNAT superfamily N-acetyltransferase
VRRLDLGRLSGRVPLGPVPRQPTGPAKRWLTARRGHPVDPLPGAMRGLRRRTARDLAPCARLLRVVHYESQYPVRWPDSPRGWLDREVLDAWVVERVGEILGHVAISPVGLDTVSRAHWQEMTGRDPDDLASVAKFFVRPSLRGQGIGTALLDVAAEESSLRGMLPVLEVVTARKEKIALLDDQGWRLLSMDPWREEPARLRVHCYSRPT